MAELTTPVVGGGNCLPTREEIGQRLLALVREIEIREGAVLVHRKALDLAKDTLAKDTLALAEFRALTGGFIDGKNAETRKAQVEQATRPEQLAVTREEWALEEARIALNVKHNEFSALKALARMLGGSE